MHTAKVAAAICLVGLGVALHHALDVSRHPADTSCGSCHIMRPYVASMSESDNLDNAHRRAGVGCIDCHDDVGILAKLGRAAGYLTAPSRALVTGLDATRAGGGGAAAAAAGLAPRHMSDGMCNRCRVGLEHQAERSDFLRRNPHRSHWPELACNDCHRAHSAQVDFCAGCHDNGGQRLVGRPLAPRTLAPRDDMAPQQTAVFAPTAF